MGRYITLAPACTPEVKGVPSEHKEIHATVLFLETQALARCHSET